MRQAAIGFRVHSGWAALVAVSLDEGAPVVLLRARPRLVRTFTYEFRQPYHTAAKRPPAEAHGFISRLRVSKRSLISCRPLCSDEIFRSKVMNSSAAVFFSLRESRFRGSLKFWHLMR